MKQVTGKFAVQTTKLVGNATQLALGMMVMQFDKVFEGDLAATGTVSMMGLMDQEVGSGGYVAIEKVTGQLGGKSGSFYLQHSSIMNRGVPLQKIQVIPDSATGELVGLKGEMVVDIRQGQHFYILDYAL